jgi:hypothetical protein
MVRPTSRGIYAPSRLRQSFQTDPRNIDAIRDFGRTILVSFEPDGISNPQPVTAYGFGWSCWYIVAPVAEAGDEG